MAKKEKKSDFVIEKKPAFVDSSFIYFLILFFIVLMSLLFLIESPDVLICDAVVTTRKKPISLHNEVAGKISKIYISPKERVKKTDAIAVMHSAANYEKVIELKERCQNVDIESSICKLAIDDVDNIGLGELSDPFIALKKAILVYENFVEHNSILKDIEGKEISIQMLKQESEFIGIKKTYEELVLSYKKESLKKDSVLFEDGFLLEDKIKKSILSKIDKENQIASYDYNEKKNILKIRELQKKIEYQKKEYDFRKQELLINLNEAHSILIKTIALWENKYVISSSYEGTIEYIYPISEGQYLPAGSELFSLVPDNNEFICYAYLPGDGASKVKMGQKVNIKLSAYPFQEFGVIEGEVSAINLSPRSELADYLIEISMKNGLESSLGTNFNFSKSMDGIVEVVLEKKNLFDKIIEKSLKMAAPKKIKTEKQELNRNKSNDK